jgi:hypothetical protein
MEILGASGIPALQYKNLGCDSGFLSLRNWGFVSETDSPSTFYLDDLSLTVR